MRDEQVPDDGLKRLAVRCDGVRVDGGHDDAGVRDLCGVAAVTADDADDRRRRPSWRTRSARTRFGLTFFSRSPPPTENTKTPSAARNRLPASHAANTVSHPSSLVRAVSSDTLSVGAYASKPASLRKSLTACRSCPRCHPRPGRRGGRRGRGRPPGPGDLLDRLGIQALDDLHRFAEMRFTDSS